MFGKGGYCAVNLSGLKFTDARLDQSSVVYFPGIMETLAEMMKTGKIIIGENLTVIRNSGPDAITSDIMVCAFNGSDDDIRLSFPGLSAKVLHIIDDTFVEE